MVVVVSKRRVGKVGSVREDRGLIIDETPKVDGKAWTVGARREAAPIGPPPLLPGPRADLAAVMGSDFPPQDAAAPSRVKVSADGLVVLAARKPRDPGDFIVVEKGLRRQRVVVRIEAITIHHVVAPTVVAEDRRVVAARGGRAIQGVVNEILIETRAAGVLVQIVEPEGMSQLVSQGPLEICDVPIYRSPCLLSEDDFGVIVPVKPVTTGECTGRATGIVSESDVSATRRSKCVANAEVGPVLPDGPAFLAAVSTLVAFKPVGREEKPPMLPKS